MLSTNNSHSFKKLNLLKKHKVEPMQVAGNVSLDDLAFLVKRLSVQVDDLVEDNKKSTSVLFSPIEPQPQAQLHPLQTQQPQQNQLPPLPPLPVQQSNHNNNNSRQDSIINNQYTKPATLEKSDIVTPKVASHTTIDPWASYVPQNYGALLQRLEDIESLQKCPNECCASTGTVSSADGVPWPQPIEPFRSMSVDHQDSNVFDVQYTHWCTLMRCLPLMDPVTSAHVKTVGLYAMREILKSKASQKREYESKSNHNNNNCCTSSAAAPVIHHNVNSTATPTKLRDSMSCLSVVGGLATTAPTATQDMPSWMTSSETKTALDHEVAPIPPTKQPMINETTNTPTPSGSSSPLFQGNKRFQKWIQYKKLSRKSNTDTANTPFGQSQTLRKIGSWFF